MAFTEQEINDRVEYVIHAMAKDNVNPHDFNLLIRWLVTLTLPSQREVERLNQERVARERQEAITKLQAEITRLENL